MSTKKTTNRNKNTPENNVGKEGTTTRTLKEYDLLQQISQEHKENIFSTSKTSAHYNVFHKDLDSLLARLTLYDIKYKVKKIQNAKTVNVHIIFPL